MKTFLMRKVLTSFSSFIKFVELCHVLFNGLPFLFLSFLFFQFKGFNIGSRSPCQFNKNFRFQPTMSEFDFFLYLFCQDQILIQRLCQSHSYSLIVISSKFNGFIRNISFQFQERIKGIKGVSKKRAFKSKAIGYLKFLPNYHSCSTNLIVNEEFYFVRFDFESTVTKIEDFYIFSNNPWQESNLCPRTKSPISC
jgi:hypothetical protein